MGLREHFEEMFPFIDHTLWTEIMNEFLASKKGADSNVVSLNFNNSYVGISKDTLEQVMGTDENSEWDEYVMPDGPDLSESD
jgi:hypothetical protein